jgi:hypothetical protein
MMNKTLIAILNDRERLRRKLRKAERRISQLEARLEQRPLAETYWYKMETVSGTPVNLSNTIYCGGDFTATPKADDEPNDGAGDD